MLPTEDQLADPEAADSQHGSRRWLLRGGGLVAVGVLAAACSDDNGSDAAPSDTGPATTTSTTGAASTTGSTQGDGNADSNPDLAIAALAASLEVLAVSTYGAALDAATAGALGEVPPAVAEFVTVAMAHHQAHLDGWNTVLSSAGEPEVTEPPADLAADVNAQFAEVTDVRGAATLALTLEETAAGTYLNALRSLQGADVITTAGSIICIDRQHAAILNFVLGQYPVPDTFAGTELAYEG